MMEYLWFYLTLTLDIFPFALGVLIVLRSKLRHALWISLLEVLLPIALYNAAICITYMNGLYGAGVMVLLRVLSSFFTYGLLCQTFRKYFVNLAFINAFTLPYMLGILQIGAFFINFIDTTGLPNFMVITLVRAGFYLFFFHPYFLVVKKILLPNFDTENKRIWVYFLISQLILDVAMIASVRTDYAANGIDNKEFFVQMVIMLVSMSVTAILFYAFKMEKEMETNRNKREHDELLLDLNSRQYKSIQENILQTKRIRHDMKHHLGAVEQMMNEEKYEEVKEYIARFMTTMPEGVKIQFCENLTINAILEFYYSLAKTKGIDIVFDVAELSECKVPPIDLNILLGNALENSIEACGFVKDQQPKIKLCAKKRTDNIFITIDNTFNGILESNDGVLMSTKRGYKKSGYGNKSMDAVAEKYGGQIKREINDNVYQVSIILKNEIN